MDDVGTLDSMGERQVYARATGVMWLRGSCERDGFMRRRVSHAGHREATCSSALSLVGTVIELITARVWWSIADAGMQARDERVAG
jgi:hypothetical protein